MPRAIGPKFPIVVTSYEVALSDARKYLRHYNWKYLVVDEVTVLIYSKYVLPHYLFILNCETLK